MLIEKSIRHLSRCGGHKNHCTEERYPLPTTRRAISKTMFRGNYSLRWCCSNRRGDGKKQLNIKIRRSRRARGGLRPVPVTNRFFSYEHCVFGRRKTRVADRKIGPFCGAQKTTFCPFGLRRCEYFQAWKLTMAATLISVPWDADSYVNSFRIYIQFERLFRHGRPNY